MGVQVQTRFDTTLNGAITDVQTTAVLDDAPAQTTGYGTFERGEASEEDVYWAGLSGLQLTGLLRGLSQTALTVTEVAGNKKAHVDGVAFEGTLLHYIINNKADVDDNEAITGAWTFNTQLPTSTDTPGADAELTTKVYVDTADALKAALAGGNTFSGNQIFADNTAQTTTNAAPNADKILANKKYVDDQIAALASFPQTLAAAISDVSATEEEIDQALDGISANVTAANLSTLTGGGNADALHRHESPTFAFTALEAVTAGNAVAALPLEVQFYDQLTDTTIALGDSNVRRRYAIAFTPLVTSSTLTTMLFRAAEQVNGATTVGDLTISIQTDNVGAPSGTPVSNGTANAITQATQRTWNTTFQNRTATWASPPTLTAGTTYWLAFECAATDAANYLKISTNAAHDENYVTLTRLTYNLDTATWGTSTTNSTPFFWFNNQPLLLGSGVVKTDANWGARTWNFVGFAKANAAAGASVEVYYDIVSGLSLTPGKDYYLSATAGAITTTAPADTYVGTTEPASFTYRVGRALSSTSLKIRTGAKRVVIRESGLSATTTRQYVTWFSPEVIRVYGAATGSNDSAFSAGLVLANAEDTAAHMSYENSAAGTAGLSTTASLNPNMNADNLAGAASGFSGAGFTYTYTETGTVTGNALLEVVTD